MAIYDFVCLKCKTEKRDFFKPMRAPDPVCCHEPMQQIYQTKIEVYDTSMVFEHIADKPMQFGSKRALRQYCRNNGMTSHYAE